MMRPWQSFVSPQEKALYATLRANQRSREAAGRDHWDLREWKLFLGAAKGAKMQFESINAALHDGASAEDMALRFGSDAAQARIRERDSIEREAGLARRAAAPKPWVKPVREATVEGADEPAFILG